MLHRIHKEAHPQASGDTLLVEPLNWPTATPMLCASPIPLWTAPYACPNRCTGQVFAHDLQSKHRIQHYSGGLGESTQLSISGDHWGKTNGRLSAPSLALQDWRRHKILTISPHIRGNKWYGMGTSIRKIWESLRGPSLASGWRYFSPEARQ